MLTACADDFLCENGERRVVKLGNSVIYILYDIYIYIMYSLVERKNIKL